MPRAKSSAFVPSLTCKQDGPVMLHLPFTPPPLSACFVNVARNGRKDSDRYKAFKRDVDAHLCKTAADLLGTPYRATFSKDVAVSYGVCRPGRRARDLDNMLKALNDTLTRNHILADDSLIVDLRIHWIPTSGNEVFVTIKGAA
jgi:Holliday junction resolvase RusA-like endonuclease